MPNRNDDNGMIRRLRALALAGLALAAVLAVWSARGRRDNVSGLLHYGQVPRFRLVQAGGAAYDSKALEGRVWVASFIYTTCKNSCPMLTAQVKRLAKSLPSGEGFALLSFSVDPDKDTPEVLARYARDAGADDPRWVFLTGTKPVLKALIRDGFKLVAEPGDREMDARGAPDILHSSKLVLVDKHGAVRGYYDGLLGSSVEAVRADAERLAKED